MRTGRDEVLDIFRKWRDDKSPIRAQGSFSGFAFGLWARMVSVESHELRLLSVNNGSELVIQLTPELQFGYGDNRIVTGEEKKFSECILISFGSTGDAGETDNIALAALSPS
jgi:hypothetical protein